MLPSERALMVPSLLMVMPRSVRLEDDRAVFAEHRIAAVGDQCAVGVDLQRAVAGVALAVGGLTARKPLPSIATSSGLPVRSSAPWLMSIQVARSRTKFTWLSRADRSPARALGAI